MTLAVGRLLAVTFCAVALLIPAHPAVAGFAAPPAPARWVTDDAGFLSPSARDTLDADLQAYQRRTGHQVIVYIGTTTGKVPLEDYTVNAFAAWKVGRKGLDDGLALFIFANDRKVRIEVGYGLEPVVTDAISSEIIRNVIVPQIRAGDNDAAVTDAVARILATIDGSPAPEMNGGGSGDQNAGNDTAGQVPWQGQPFSPIMIISGLIILIGFIVLFIRSPGFALWLLFTLMSGGRGGGGFSGGGGGFSGGGGRSGGGGASGSW